MTLGSDVLACPHCARHFRINPAVLVKKIRCRGCRQPFFVPRDASPPGSPTGLREGTLVEPARTMLEPAPPSSLPRAIEAMIDGADVRKCPDCGRAFSMRKEFEGKTIRCRGCRSLFVIAATGASPSPHAHASVPKPPSLAASRPPASPASGHAHEPGGTLLEQPAIYEDVGDVLEREATGESYPAALPTPYRLAESDGAENPLPQFLAIVAGGTAALPIAQLILWWVMGRDPLNLAPQLPASLEWMAPAEFRD